VRLTGLSTPLCWESSSALLHSSVLSRIKLPSMSGGRDGCGAGAALQGELSVPPGEGALEELMLHQGLGVKSRNPSPLYRGLQ